MFRKLFAAFGSRDGPLPPTSVPNLVPKAPSSPSPQKIRRISSITSDHPTPSQPPTDPDRVLGQYLQALPDELVTEILSTAAIASRRFAITLTHVGRRFRSEYGLKFLLHARSFETKESLCLFLDGLSTYGRDDQTPELSGFIRDRANFVRCVLIGSNCDPDDVVRLLDRCHRISQIALPFSLFCALFNPSSEVARVGHLDIRCDVSGQPRFPLALLERHDLQITILDEVRSDLWDSLQAEQPNNTARNPIPGTPLHRVTRLIFAHSPPPNLHLHPFTRLTHIALPSDSRRMLPNPDHLAYLFGLDSINMIVILVPPSPPSSLNPAQRMIATRAMHSFPHGRLFALPHERPLYADNSYSPTYLQNWRNATSGPDFWDAAAQYTVEHNRDRISTLEFEQVDHLKEFVASFNDERSLWHSVEFGTETPASFIHNIQLHPSTDVVPGVAQVLNSLALKNLALSPQRFEELSEVTRMPNVYQTSHTRASDLRITILDSNRIGGPTWPSVTGTTPLSGRITRIHFDGKIQLGVAWDCFPNLAQVAYANFNIEAALDVLPGLGSSVERVIFVPEYDPVSVDKGHRSTRVALKGRNVSDSRIYIAGGHTRGRMDDYITLWDRAFPL